MDQQFILPFGVVGAVVVTTVIFCATFVKVVSKMVEANRDLAELVRDLVCIRVPRDPVKPAAAVKPADQTP